MNRFFYGNFYFEEQLRGESQRSARIERMLWELAPCWLAIADAHDRIWCPAKMPRKFLDTLGQWGLPPDLFVSDAQRIPPGMELVPWGWSPAAVEFGERNRLVVNCPPLDIVQLANSREYSVPLEVATDEGFDFATLCRQLGEVLACIERVHPTTVWGIKANWSHAARERILGRGPHISDADLQWVKQRLSRDGVVSWELWLPRESELGIQWQITQGTAPELVAVTELLVDARGQYAGTRSMAVPTEEATDWAQVAAQATRPAVIDMAHRGYFGPVGIDAMRYRHPERNGLHIRPLQDINARWTMGRLAAGWFARFDTRQPLTWWHGDRPAQTDGEASCEWIATSPETLDGRQVRHRTWLKIEPANE